MRKSHRVAHNRITLILTLSAILLALAEPIISIGFTDRFLSDIAYAFVRDVEFIFISLAMLIYLSASPASFWLKTSAHAFATIQITSFLVNIAIQSDVVSDGYGTLLFAFITGAIIGARNIIVAQNFQPDADKVFGQVGFWRLYKRPSSLLTWLLFTFDSASGHYSVTDGKVVWYFSHKTGCMVKEKLARSWLRGKVAKPLKADHSKLKHKLNSLVGTKFTTRKNCATILRWV